MSGKLTLLPRSLRENKLVMNKSVWKVIDFDCVEYSGVIFMCARGYSSIFLWQQHSLGSLEDRSSDDWEDEVADEEYVDKDEDSCPLATSTVFKQVPVQPQHVHVVEEPRRKQESKKTRKMMA